MPSCFVIMGFGRKTDLRTRRELELDITYNDIIKPAVIDSGIECIRADEITHSGVIDLYMYKYLLEAEVVIADISTLNSNAVYELGIRHALRPYSTIVISEDQLIFPFDLSHIKIHSYGHLGISLELDKAERLRKELKKWISEILIQHQPAVDSPLYTFLQNLEPPRIKQPISTSYLQNDLHKDRKVEIKSLLSAMQEPIADNESYISIAGKAIVAMSNENFEKARLLYELLALSLNLKIRHE